MARGASTAVRPRRSKPRIQESEESGSSSDSEQDSESTQDDAESSDAASGDTEDSEKALEQKVSSDDDDDDDEEEEENGDGDDKEDSPVPVRPRDGRISRQVIESGEESSAAEEPSPPIEEVSDGGGASDEDELPSAPVAANLTRRQRAKLSRDHGEELMELPVEAKRSRFSAEESALRKSEHARRRKFQSMQRAEQLKNDTINRLLNKQTSKGRNKVADDSETRSTSVETSSAAPTAIRYLQRYSPKAPADGATPTHVERALLLPNGMDISDILPSATGKDHAPVYPPPAPTCYVAGCTQRKKYTVASHAACSLEHWRTLKQQQQQPPLPLPASVEST
ncbi:INO80 complex subunit B [Coemansia sp. RSA 552]|nr:INO80 complex subunit B [Coemansia sp. RSA 552]